MKRIVLLFVMISFLLVPVINSTPVAWAGDDLIDVLERKGVLTSEEAAEAKKADQLPKGLKGVGIHGTYFLEYYDLDSDNDANDFSGFRVQRAYFTVKKKFNDWFSSRLTSRSISKTSS